MFLDLMNGFRRWWSGSRFPTTSALAKRRVSLRLEEFEQRIVPTFVWNGPADCKWSVAGNWWDTTLNNGNGGAATVAPSESSNLLLPLFSVVSHQLPATLHLPSAGPFQTKVGT